MTLILLGILVVGLIIALIYWLASSWGAGPRLPDPSSPQYQTPVQPSGDMAADVRAMLVRKQKIGAVKMVRERTGWGLKEAKDYVDTIETTGLPPAVMTYSNQASSPVAPPRARQDERALDTLVRDLLAQDQKIQAVKLVRERTGWGLKEAKDYVDAHERGRPLVDLGSAPTAAPDGDLADDVRDLVSQGQTIHAVKLVRERTGWGLKEAKDYVDAIRAERGL